MDERLQEALGEITVIVQQSQSLSLRERDALAARLETMASSLRWELLFLLPTTETPPSLDVATMPRTPQSGSSNAM